MLRSNTFVCVSDVQSLAQWPPNTFVCVQTHKVLHNEPQYICVSDVPSHVQCPDMMFQSRACFYVHLYTFQSRAFFYIHVHTHMQVCSGTAFPAPTVVIYVYTHMCINTYIYTHMLLHRQHAYIHTDTNTACPVPTPAYIHTHTHTYIHRLEPTLPSSEPTAVDTASLAARRSRVSPALLPPRETPRRPLRSHTSRPWWGPGCRWEMKRYMRDEEIHERWRDTWKMKR